MPSSHEVRQLPYSAEQMFDLVADVGSYPKFLPWVIATRILRADATEMVADMVVGFKAIREKFTSRVMLERPTALSVQYIDGPLQDLTNVWAFRPIDEESCEIDFRVDFKFKSRVFETLAGAYFDRAFNKMVAAFEARANELYGPPASPLATA